MFGMGVWEILLIFLVILLLFGAKRLPEIGSSLGKGIREFKGSLREIEDEFKVDGGGGGGRQVGDGERYDTAEHRNATTRRLLPEERPSVREEGGDERSAAADGGGEEEKPASS